MRYQYKKLKHFAVTVAAVVFSLAPIGLPATAAAACKQVSIPHGSICQSTGAVTCDKGYSAKYNGSSVSCVQNASTNSGGSGNGPSSCRHPFFGLQPWYQYLHLDSNCNITGFTLLGTGGNSGLLLVGLAVLDDLIRVAALVAFGYIVYGGFKYITSQGSPDATTNARETIINALIGLVLAVLAASIVTFVGNKLGNL